MYSQRLHALPARIFSVTLSLLVLALLLLVNMHVPIARAGTTINVDTELDENGNDGHCSLREAIISANTNPSPAPVPVNECEAGRSGLDTINLPAGTYTLTIPGKGEDNAGTGDLDIREDLIIQGASSSTSKINANTIDRVFDVFGPAHVTLSDLRLDRGQPGPSESGGGVRVGSSSAVTLTDILVIANESDIGGGGLVIEYGATADVMNSSFANNSATFGGAIHNSGTLRIAHATVSWWMPGTPAASYGGGLENHGTAQISDSSFYDLEASSGGGAIRQAGSSLELDRVTIRDNRVTGGDGGGIYAMKLMTLTNVTLSGNAASGNGGALYRYDNWPATTLIHTTIYSNSATKGGGIFRDGSQGSLLLQSSIVAGNTGGNCSGTITSQGYNLDSENTCGLNATGDLTNTNPLLGPLAMNGGLYETHALLPGSPAIDRIPIGTNGCGTTITADQRGISRPVGSKCDIGAFELVPNLYLPLILK